MLPFGEVSSLLSLSLGSESDPFYGGKATLFILASASPLAGRATTDGLKGERNNACPSGGGSLSAYHQTVQSGLGGHGPWRAELSDDVTRQGVSPNGRLFVPGGLVFCPGLGWPDAAPVFNHQWGNGLLILTTAQSF